MREFRPLPRIEPAQAELPPLAAPTRAWRMRSHAVIAVWAAAIALALIGGLAIARGAGIW